MNRSSKTRTSNYYSNSQLQVPVGKVGEVQHRSIEQSFTEDEVDSQA
jgi:chromosome segregation ATPase